MLFSVVSISRKDKEEYAYSLWVVGFRDDIVCRL